MRRWWSIGKEAACLWVAAGIIQTRCALHKPVKARRSSNKMGVYSTGALVCWIKSAHQQPHNANLCRVRTAQCEKARQEKGRKPAQSTQVPHPGAQLGNLSAYLAIFLYYSESLASFKPPSHRPAKPSQPASSQRCGTPPSTAH